MRQGRDWMQRLTDGLDLPGTPLPGVTLVELVGDQRVLIEHHGGITQYSREQICVKVSFGSVVICGCDLILARMAPGQLVIRGKIGSVALHREGVK